MMVQHPVGSLVAVRGREWVILPSDDPDLLPLRPISGSERELADIYFPLRLELMLLAATPHSGVEESFRSLLGLLHPRFERWER